MPPTLAGHLLLTAWLLPDSFGLGADPASRLARMEVAFVRELEQAAAPPAPPPLKPRRRAPVLHPAVPASAPAQGELSLADASGAVPPAAAASGLDKPQTPERPQTSERPERPDPDAGPPASSSPEPAASTPATEPGADVPPAAPAADVPTAPTAAASAASASEPVASIPEAPAAAAAALAASASAGPAAAAAAFEWPPSTRLSFTLTGNYRGPVEGQARVEWLKAGNRYQVHLEVSIGPSFAPLVSRRLSSEGVVGARGLEPRRYEEETRVPFRGPRRQVIDLDADRVRLPSGTEHARPSGVQDSASQFVQMTWIFTTQPEWLTPGRTIVLPLALPRHVERWTYDVLANETLQTPFGEVPTVHVQPRRPPRAGGDLTAEFWVAPTLQYLPVRIVIRQDAETYVDLMIERLPQQAAERR